MPFGWSALVVVGDEASAGLVGEPVVPDAGGEREHALADAGPDAVGGVSAVTLERKLALECVVDRLDPLPDATKRAEAGLLALAVGTDELGAERVVDEALELRPCESLVGDEDLLPVQQRAAGSAFQQRRGDLALRFV